ncbi:MAG: hypothetical protein GX878_07420 [Firmicutes bacterium]|nr:hypothetical protein [Bacillota bacterium]
MSRHTSGSCIGPLQARARQGSRSGGPEVLRVRDCGDGARQDHSEKEAYR